MTVTDLLQNAQRVIDAQGQNKAIQLDWSVWESLLAYLKDLDEPDATEELLATPGLVEALEGSRQRLQQGQYTRYEELKRQV